MNSEKRERKQPLGLVEGSDTKTEAGLHESVNLK